MYRVSKLRDKFVYDNKEKVKPRLYCAYSCKTTNIITMDLFVYYADFVFTVQNHLINVRLSDMFNEIAQL